jgi:hypothetical protein
MLGAAESEPQAKVDALRTSHYFEIWKASHQGAADRKV